MQDAQWVTRDGQVMEIAAMSRDHCQSSRFWMERQSRALHEQCYDQAYERGGDPEIIRGLMLSPGEWLVRTPLYKRLKTRAES